MIDVLIYGAGGLARELASMMSDYCTVAYQVKCFVERDTPFDAPHIGGFPVLDAATAHARFPHAAAVIGVGTPRTREQIVAQLTNHHFPVIQHRTAQVDKTANVGEGAIICGHNIISVDARIGRHVFINYHSTIGHDAIIGDYSSLMGSVSVSGHVHIGQRVYIGTGAILLHGTDDAPLIIGDDAVIGAGAVVTRHVAAGTTVVGIPAKPLPPR